MKEKYKQNWIFKLKMLAVFGSLLFVSSAMAQLNGAAYTIDATNSTNGTNFQSFQDLRDTLTIAGVSGPVEINVVASSGPYTESVEFVEVAGASYTNSITINGNGNTISVNENFVIWLNGADHFHINDFILENQNNVVNETFVVIFGNNSDSNSITNSELIISTYNLANTSTLNNVSAYISLLSDDFYSTNWLSPTNVTNATGNTFEGNKMWNGTGNDDVGPTWGVYVEGEANGIFGNGFSRSTKISDNQILSTRVGGIHHFDGRGAEISGNTISDAVEANVWYGIYSWFGEGDFVTSNSYRIMDNVIENVEVGRQGNGIYTFYLEGNETNPAEISGNIVRNCSVESGSFFGIYLAGRNGGDANLFSRHIVVKGNEVSNNEAGSDPGDTFFGIYFQDILEGIAVMNNAILNNRLADPNQANSQYGIYSLFSNDHVFCVNNTVHWIDSTRWTSMIYYEATGTADSVVIANNIFRDASNTANPNNTNFIIGAEIRSTFTPTVINNNIYSSNSVNFGGNVNRVMVQNNTSLFQLTNTAWSDLGFDLQSLEVDPLLVDPANGDVTPQNHSIANLGLTGYTTEDILGGSRTACGPDPGAIEFFTDYSAANLIHVTTPDICGNSQPEISVDVVNPFATDILSARVFYSLNGADELVETLDVATANSANSYSFLNPPIINKAGTNTITVGVFCDDNDANNTITQSFNAIAVPSGGSLSANTTTFEGYRNQGNMAEPDVTVNGYTNVYDIAPPTQPDFANGVLGTDYTYSLSAITANGTDVTNLGFTLNGSEVTVNPSTVLSDSTIFIEVTVSSVAAGCDTSFGRWMYVPHTPVPSFTFADVCLGDIAEFINTSTLLGNDFIVAHWEFNDPSGSTLDFADVPDASYKYENFGNAIPVELTVSNGNYPKFEYSITDFINVTPLPEADFSVVNACEGENIMIINNTSLPAGLNGNISYSWDFGGEQTIGNIVNPTYTFATAGQRTITMTASSAGCEAVLARNAYQFERPIADFESIGDCNLTDVEFSSTSTIASGSDIGVAWDFNGEGVSRIQNPNFAFATSGNKTITLIASSEFGCEDMVVKTITLIESPEADFSYDRACNLTPINFTVTGNVPNGVNSTYAWDFDGENVSAQENPSYLFDQVGTRLVTLSIEDVNGCISTITKPVEVLLQSAVDFDASDVCFGDEAVFVNRSTVASGGNVAYVWTFGDGNTSTDFVGKNTYTQANLYDVTLVGNVEGGCSDEITKQITVQSVPDASFTTGKEGRQLNITGPAGNDEYRWTFGNGGSSSDQSPVYEYTNVDNGIFEVCLATRIGDCWSENCETVSLDLASISDLTENNAMINVYPNPTSGRFTVSIENAGDAVVKVGDILGNVLDVQVEDNFDGTFGVDMSAVADGVYFVQVKNGDFYATKRITISK